MTDALERKDAGRSQPITAAPIRRGATLRWHPTPAPAVPVPELDIDIEVEYEVELEPQDEVIELGDIDPDLEIVDASEDGITLGEIDGDLELVRDEDVEVDFEHELELAYTDDDATEREPYEADGTRTADPTGFTDDALHEGTLGFRLRLGDMIPGTRIRVDTRSSEGASGIVYRGEHVDLERPLAIKVLRRELSSTLARMQFLVEARTIASIESPYVARVTDFGRLPDGRPWYAMEFVDGCSLASRLAESGALDLPTTLVLLRMAARALAACHARGIVHCDVKPANLLLRDRGSELVLVDFGIARAVGTRPATVCGTPEYMAPEQIERDAVDGRADQYALAYCGYEMLCGRSLLAGCSAEEMLLRHVEGLTVAGAITIPPAIEEVLARALRPAPTDRYPSMAAFESSLCEAASACGLDFPVALEPSEAEEVRSPTGRSGLRARGAAMALTHAAALAVGFFHRERPRLAHP